MTYSARLRQAIGDVRATLVNEGVISGTTRMREHGEHAPAEHAPLVLVACSGGRDSLALALVAAKVCAMFGVRCGAVIVDHQLQEDSANVAQRTARVCEDAGLHPVTVRRVQVVDAGTGLEDAARTARYEAIVDEARRCGAAAVLLAHTQTDQAETVLMGVLRTVGVDAVVGIPARAVRGGIPMLRPFLNLTREDTAGICADAGVSWWDDPTNGEDVGSDAFGGGDGATSAHGLLPAQYPLRSRVRHDVMPVLRAVTGASVQAHLAYGASVAAAERDFLCAQARQAWARCVREEVAAADTVAAARAGERMLHEGEMDDVMTALAGVTLAVKPLAAEHAAIRRRVIAMAMSRLGMQPSARHVLAVERLVTDWHGQGAVHLPSKYSASRQKHVIRLCQDGEHANC